VRVPPGDRPVNTADGIEALPVMAFAQEVLDGSF
jgi:hypothetical protein